VSHVGLKKTVIPSFCGSALLNGGLEKVFEQNTEIVEFFFFFNNQIDKMLQAKYSIFSVSNFYR